jgi:hypothetical protein
MAYRKKYPDSLVVKCNKCQNLYTYRRVSKTSKTYYLIDDTVCGTRCFEPTIVCRALEGCPGAVRIFPDFIMITAS